MLLHAWPTAARGSGPGQLSELGTECIAPMGHSRCQGQARGSHLAEGRARPGGASRPARCRSAPRQRPRPQTPPGQGRHGQSSLARSGEPLPVRGPLPVLTLQACSACTSTLPRRHANPPWAVMLSTCCLAASSTWTRSVPAMPLWVSRSWGRVPPQAPWGLPGTGAGGTLQLFLPQPLTWIVDAQVVPEGQAGRLGQGPVLL